MSGHNKWASIKHKKAITDSKRGNLFTKLVKEITVAAKIGGGDATSNSRLRTAIDIAKNANMPLDNIKKAIQRGTGELPGVVYEELVYEGYGPGGVAMIVEVTTDNKNRAAAEIRKIFSVYGGNMGESGCVAWMFETFGFIEVSKLKINEEELMEMVLDFGALDFKVSENFEIYTEQKDLEKIVALLKDKNIEIISSIVTKIPQNKIKLEGKQAEQMLKFMDKIDSQDDVQNVYANFDIADDLIEQISENL